MTGEQSNQQPNPQGYPPYYEEDEINLIDYLRVLWKWKWLIVAGTMLCVIAAAVISLQMPRIYEVSMLIEPGIAGVKEIESDGFFYIDSAENISGKITEGVYTRRVKDSLQLEPGEAGADFKAVVVKNTNLIKVTSEWHEEDRDLGVKFIRQMVIMLSDDYRKMVEQKRGDYDNRISLMQNEISEVATHRKDIDKQVKLELSKIEKIRNEIKIHQAILGDIEQRKGELLEEVKGVKDNTGKIVQQQEALLRDERPGKDLSLLLYSTTIQQNVAYFNQLNNQVYDLGVRQKTIETAIDGLSKTMDDIKTGIERLNLNKTEGLQTKIYAINAQINKLDLEKGLISNIKAVKDPEVSLYPIKPKKKQIVLLAGFASLFIFVFLAFFVEYIRNASEEE